MCDQMIKTKPSEGLDEDVLSRAVAQANSLKQSTEENGLSSPQDGCTQEDRIQCALQYGPEAIDNKIIVSISENINTMAKAINDSEEQKNKARSRYITFFQVLLVFMILFAGILIVADTFCGVHVRTEFMLSVIAAIIADILAIVKTLVKYMTNVEHYEAYNKLIESLLKRINHGR